MFLIWAKQNQNWETYAANSSVEARCTSVQSFNQAGDLRRRIVTHSKERAYNCVQCNKSFGVAGSLKTHMLAHSGVKNHTCSECGKSFGQSGYLRSHRSPTLGRKYANVQNDLFGLAEHLKRHKLTHSGEKPYKCPQCHYTCSQAGTLVEITSIHIP